MYRFLPFGPLPFLVLFLHCLSLTASAQQNFIDADGQIAYGDMDSWWSRSFDNSGWLGGGKIYYQEPGPEHFQKIKGQIVEHTPWASSNVRAKVGVSTGSVNVFAEPRMEGFCARLETKLERVKVLGIVNIKAIASGTVFLGSMQDPVKGVELTRKYAMCGIPFERRPVALLLDYKVRVGAQRLRALGKTKVEKVDGGDAAQVYVLLQSRSVNSRGELLVKRVATAWLRLENSQEEWVNEFAVPFYYGDIQNQSFYKEYMGLISEADPYFTELDGEAVPFVEHEWAGPEDPVTHLLFFAESSYEGSKYIGSEENTLWIDNILLQYE